MSLSQHLQQKLLQKLSPQQIQLMKLLQVPTANLEQRIKDELEENPALEEGDNLDDNFQDETDEFADSLLNDDYSHDGDGEENEYEEPEESYDNIDITEYVAEGDDEIADYRLKDDNYQDQDDVKTLPFKIETTFHDMLNNQLGMLKLNPVDTKIAEQIVGSIDDDGYLHRDTAAMVDDLAFLQNVEVSEEEIEAMIKKIQLFDPAGICARDLQECLLLQLERKRNSGKSVELAIAVLTKYFEEFTKKHYDKILKGLNLTDDELKEVIKQIIKLNPKPGGQIGVTNKAESYIVPDFFIVNNNGELELTLNSKNAPDLRISEGYRDMLKDYDRGSKKDKRQKEAVMFIKQKIDSAKWFIDAIKQRQHTLMLTMQTILDYQYNFFLTGDETTLRPMILKDIAERTGLDISTISRVANSKFVQTEFGTYRLKFFFSESLSTESGEEVSTREVKKILSDLIEYEHKKKPLSDEKLADMLNEKGYNIARRTIAKYREQLNIPVARLRKEL